MIGSTPSPPGLGLGTLSTSVVHTTCTAGCRTFLWGGTGEPTYDEDGLCWCSCDGDGWSDVNILGRPSCVPVAAHLTFGWVGLVFSMSALFHAAFHLRRQIRFHGERRSAATSPVEQCRRQLHVTTMLLAILSVVYFALVVTDKLRVSLFVLFVLQIPVCISVPILTTRMWIYTNDRRVLQKSPEVMKICIWFETRAGHYVTYSLVSITPVGSAIFASASRAEAAIRLTSAGIIVLSSCMFVGFWVCGQSLLKGIDESLKHQRQKQDQLQKMRVLLVNGKELVAPSSLGRSSGDAMLLAARKKVKTVVMFAIGLFTKVICLLFISVVSPYGFEAPLLLFISPMSLIPPLWNMANVNIHRGRTKLSRGLLLSPSSVASYGPSRLASLSATLFSRPRKGQHQVAAMETSTVAP